MLASGQRGAGAGRGVCGATWRCGRCPRTAGAGRPRLLAPPKLRWCPPPSSHSCHPPSRRGLCRRLQAVLGPATAPPPWGLGAPAVPLSSTLSLGLAEACGGGRKASHGNAGQPRWGALPAGGRGGCLSPAFPRARLRQLPPGDSLRGRRRRRRRHRRAGRRGDLAPPQANADFRFVLPLAPSRPRFPPGPGPHPDVAGTVTSGSRTLGGWR